MIEANEDGHLSGRDRILINCGGVRHETFRSTLRNFPDTRLAWCTENTSNNPDYDSEKGEFFFDRHPGVFAQIINYYRTGKLHTPHDVCGPLFEEELGFWGIDEKQMESCCWSYYTQHREAQENLKFFDDPNLTGNADNESNQDDFHSEADIEEEMTTLCWQRYKSRIWSVLENHRSSKTGKVVFALSLSFIIISVLAYCLLTWETVRENDSATLAMIIIEGVCGAWFTIEFGLRVASCPSKKDFLKQVMNWIDFIAILPFYVRIAQLDSQSKADTSTEYDVLATFRLFRLLRFFKVDLGFQILKQTMIASSRELLLLVMLLIIPVIIFANFAYISEKNKNDKFASIPDSLWWAIITITTVGYGDIAPTTLAGKVFGSLCAATSIIITALPISIIGNNFSLYYSHAQAQMKLPKKTRHTLVGAANALIADSARPSEDLSDDLQPVDTTTLQNGSIGEVNAFPYKGRYRRARSSLYAGGIVQRQSLPIRTRSNEDVANRASPEDRKKSHTSTQSTTIDTPPKTPPAYGNMLTVGLPEMIETIIDFEKHPTDNWASSPKNQDALTTHRESDEFDLDDVDNPISLITERKSNGIKRPGTPVKRAPKHAVRFVKPTLTVTADDIPTANFNDTFEDSENDEEEQKESVGAVKESGKTTGRPWSQSGGVAPLDAT